jgi:RNA polymerase sigma-54 factor
LARASSFDVGPAFSEGARLTMALGPRLDLRQSLQLVMTPQLQQAIKLLTLTNLELEAYIGEEIERNPLLDASGDDAGDDRSASADGDGDGDVEVPTSDQLMLSGDAASDAPLDADYAAETFHHDGPTDSATYESGADKGFDGGGDSGAGGTAALGDGGDFESFAAAEPSLLDLLLEQAGATFDGAELIIARHLIDQIDEAGYLTVTIEEIADRLDADPAVVACVLAAVQRFEPTGVGARSLGECLALQAREADRLDPAMAALLDNLDLLARGDMVGLRRACGVDSEDLADMIRELRGYNPKPGLRYGGERPQPVLPDVFVRRLANGDWGVELNTATLPRVLVDRGYYVELSGAGGRSPEAARATRNYLSDCLASATWLVKALDQRARTIIKVASELVKQQEAFFEQGVHHLKPLTLRKVAEAIGMHESTVSRVTSNKYLACDRGLFELKYFFTSAIQSSDGGDAVSAEAVKDRISRLIAGETVASILSDDKLVDVLNAEGFGIARRTVAKYREALGLGSSVARRRAKLLEASR